MTPDFEYYKQNKDYNCGVWALKYILKLVLNKEYDSEILEKELNTTEDNGTSHVYILKFLCKENIDFIEVTGNVDKLPLLINYQYDGDGHYGVIVNKYEGVLEIFNPATGKIEEIFNHEFIAIAGRIIFIPEVPVFNAIAVLQPEFVHIDLSCNIRVRLILLHPLVFYPFLHQAVSEC